jgi:hypothetical protein
LRQTILDARRVVITLLLQQKDVVRSEVNRHQLRAAVLPQETRGESKLCALDRVITYLPNQIIPETIGLQGD